MKKPVAQKLTIAVVLMMLGMTCLTAVAETSDFTMPTPDEIEAAAGDPSAIAALLDGASPEQAASIVRDVLVAVITQGQEAGLSVAAIAANVQVVVETATAAIPIASQTAFAQALAATIAATPIIAATQEFRAAVQAGAQAGGASGTNLGRVFGDAYAATVTSLPGTPPGGTTSPEGRGYPGQQI